MARKLFSSEETQKYWLLSKFQHDPIFQDEFETAKEPFSRCQDASYIQQKLRICI